MNKKQIRSHQLHALRHVFFELIDQVVTIAAMYGYLVAPHCPPIRVASPHLIPIATALLHYLEQADIVTVSPQLREALANADRKLGARTLKLLTWLLHTYPFNAQGKVYGRYARWRAHALWLYSSKPNCRDYKSPIAILRALLRSANYGRYNPIVFVPFRSKAIAYRIREKCNSISN